MPTVLRRGGFDVSIRTRDHLPPHVHVFHSGLEVVILLGIKGGLPTVRDKRGMPERNMRRALELVAENQEMLWLEWERIHG